MIEAPLGVPMIEVATQGDVLVTHILRRPDSDAPPDLFRRYEIAGASHVDSWLAQLGPTNEDFQRAGGVPISIEGCVPSDYGVSDFPLHYALNVMWDNLDAWVVKGIRPPRARSLELKPLRNGLDVQKDSHGNAVGGVRSIEVDVPTATWSGSRGGPGRCQRIGYSVPLDATTLKALYPAHEDYVRKVIADVHRLRIGHWLTAEDAQSIVSDAKAATSVPGIGAAARGDH